jgi:hypothetical protein
MRYPKPSSLTSRWRLKWQQAVAVVVLIIAPIASAFADSGWYLVIPPMSKFDAGAEYLSGYKIQDSKPLSRWFQQSAYDTASECEDAKQALLLLEHNYYAKMSESYIAGFSAKDDAAMMKHKRWSAETADAKVNAMIASRCVKSDDPRLAK